MGNGYIYFVSAVCVVVHLCITKGPVKLRFKDLRIDKKMLGSIARIGIPIGLQTSMYSFANILIQANLNRYGSIVMASWTAANKVDSFCFAPVSAFGGAINTYVGQNYGAKEYDRIKKGVLTTILMAEITAFIMMIPLLIYAKPVLSLFNDNPQVLEYGKQIMFMVIPVYTLFGLSEVLSGTLKGVGRTITSAIVSFTGILLVRVIWLYAVLPFFQTERVLFMVHPISWIVTSVIFVVYFIVMGWKRIFTVPTLGKKSKLAQAEDALKEGGQGGMIE
jgi:Na+-driven multidrug efflux pump